MGLLFMRNNLRYRSLGLAVVCVSLTTSCSFNVFDPIDSPSGDAQLQSAARACLDEGDYECAARLYGEMSDGYSDVANSEEAFLLLDQNGLGMTGIMEAIGEDDSSGGQVINALVERIYKSGITTSREDIFKALIKANSINQNELRGLVRMMGSLALLAQLLHETKQNLTTENFLKTDIVSNAATCITGELAGCLAGCTARLAAGNYVDFDTATELNGGPTLYMIQALVLQLDKALGSTELNGGGKFSSGTLSFAETLKSAEYGPDTSPGCYSYLLISNGLGRN